MSERLMTEFHSLLKRQLRRFAADSESMPQQQAELWQAINDAYLQFDEDRRMLEHSLELTSQELLERNAELSRSNADLELRVAERTASLRDSVNFIHALYQVAQSVITLESLPDVIESVVNIVAVTLAADRATLIIFDHEAQKVTHVVSAGPGVEEVMGTIAYHEFMDGLSGWALRELRPAISPKGHPDPRESPLVQQRRIDTNCGSIVVLPLLYLGETLGTLTAINTPQQPDFTAQEVTWMETIANQAATAIGRAQIYDQLKKANLLLEQQRQRLQAERDLLQALMDNVPDLIYFKDTSSRFTRINRAQARFLGVETPEQAIGKTDFDLQNTDLAQGFYEEEQRLVQSGEPVVNRIEFNPTADGQARWLSTTKVPIKDEAGRVISIVGVSHDITQRRQAEEALAAERDLLQALMDNIPDTIYFKDGASRFTRINAAQAKMLGLSAAEAAIGKTDLDFQDPELARKFYEEEQRIIETGEPLVNRIEFNPTKDGQSRWLSATKVPFKDSAGRVVGIVGVSRDITQRMHAEEALRLSEERFRLMSWATKDAVWDLDLNTNRIWWGTGLQKVFHYASDVTETDREWWLAHIHPQDQQKVDRSMKQALEAGMEFWSKEYRFQRVDGTYADIMDRGYIQRDEHGTPYRIIGAMMDTTERKQNEETIRQQNHMLSSLHQITLDLLRYRELEPLLGRLVELSAEFMDAPFVEIMLAEEDALVVKATTPNQSRMIGLRLGREEALLSWQAFDTHEPAVLSDYASWPHRKADYDEFVLRAAAEFPILNDDRCLGVLALGRDKPGYEFTFDQIQSGRLLASLTALVLNNAQLREALREQSIRDPLTGLFNRRYMEEALKQQLSRVTRNLHPLGVIMLDIDHFKQVNDTHGHAMGDTLLRELGQLLKGHVRAEDIACRYGGEEFIMIMPDASLEATQQRAEYLRQAVKQLRVQPAQNDGQALEGISLSLGVAVYPQHGRTKESVLRAADAALYRAKQEGRDRVIVA